MRDWRPVAPILLLTLFFLWFMTIVSIWMVNLLETYNTSSSFMNVFAFPILVHGRGLLPTLWGWSLRWRRSRGEEREEP